MTDQTPAKLRDEMHEALDAILGAASPEKAQAVFDEAPTELDGRADTALRVLEEGFEDATAVLALPAKYRRRLRTTNMVERFIEEIGRREKVIRIFPNQRAAWRLVGALCAEQHEEWSTGRLYLRHGRVPPLEDCLDWASKHMRAAAGSSLTFLFTSQPDGMAIYTENWT